jgi:adenylate cyclase
MNQLNHQSIVHDLTEWVSRAALDTVTVEELVAGFCEQVVASGIPLARMQISTGVIHPGMRGYGQTWWRGKGLHSEEAFQHQDKVNQRWYRSPGIYMLENDLLHMTARLDAKTRPEPWFDLYDDLIAEGITEYYTEGFAFGWDSTADHETHMRQIGIITSWSSDRPGGFGSDLDALRLVLPVFALAMKTVVFTEMAQTLMATYVGEATAGRILHGDVHRGDVRAVPAAILLADLQGFTTLSDRIPSDEMVALLNLYLDPICAAVHAQGGEVLKFLGDGLLAIFRQDGPGKAEAAFAAGKQSLRAVREMNANLEAVGKPLMPLDIALHLGEVSHGNIGAEGRLDFTVIGPAVNEAARMETACGILGQEMLISEALALELGKATPGLTDLGEHELRGVSTPRRLYGVTVE